jgi:hypothetical protein
MCAWDLRHELLNRSRIHSRSGRRSLEKRGSDDGEDPLAVAVVEVDGALDLEHITRPPSSLTMSTPARSLPSAATARRARTRLVIEQANVGEKPTASRRSSEGRSLRSRPCAEWSTEQGTTADAILEEFKSHRLVAISEIHRWAPLHVVLRSRVKSPDFFRFAQDIVVEFGNARFQRLADRWIVQRQQLSPALVSRIWLPTTQRESGVWEASMYRQFFESVRTANLTLPRPRSATRTSR